MHSSTVVILNVLPNEIKRKLILFFLKISKILNQFSCVVVFMYGILVLVDMR